MGLFTLEVQVTGLCLFVAEPQAKRMHVLLPTVPTTRCIHNETIPAHEAWIEYDGALEGTTGTKRKVIAHTSVDLTPSTHIGSICQLPAQVPNLHCVVFKDVRRDCLGEEAPARLLARVTLPMCSLASPVTGARWDLSPNCEPEMSSMVKWRIPIQEDGFAWKQASLVKNVPIADPLPTQGLQFRRDMILKIKHTPPMEQRYTVPKRGSFAHHFMAYYALLESAGGPEPMLIQHLPGQNAGDVVEPMPAAMDGQGRRAWMMDHVDGRRRRTWMVDRVDGLSPYACMVAQAQLES